MKNALFILVFLTCISGVSVSVVRLIAHPQLPPLALQASPSRICDLGTLRQGVDATARFELENRVERTIHIKDIAVSCDCTKYDISNRTLEPHGRAVLTLTYSTGTRRGEVHADAAVSYDVDDDPDPRLLTLRTIATIDPEFDVIPKEITFDAPANIVARIKLQPRHVPHVHVISANSDKRFISTSLVDTDEVEVLLDPNAYYPEAGPASLFVYTDSDKQPILKVPISITRTEHKYKETAGR